MKWGKFLVLALLALIAGALVRNEGHKGFFLALTLIPWALVLPMWPWSQNFPLWLRLVLLAALALAALAMSLWLGSSDYFLTLFAILIAFSAFLPRPFPYFGYSGIAIFALIPFAGHPFSWVSMFVVMVTLFATIVFSENFIHLRDANEEKRKLLDTLIETQRALEKKLEVSERNESSAKLEGEILATDNDADTIAQPRVQPVATETEAGMLDTRIVVAEAESSQDFSHAGSESSSTVRPLSLSFTRRDREVLTLIVSGFANKEIADRLYISEGTVKNRVSMILEKIGAKNRTQAALRARDLGIL